MSLLGIDIGTSGCKAGTFSEKGCSYAVADRGYTVISGSRGFSELDANGVWSKVKDIIKEVVSKTPSSDPVKALSVCSFGEAVVPVTAAREILSTSILSYDVRGEEYVNTLREKISQEDFYTINPNIFGVNYTLPKIAWLRDNEPELYDRTEYFLLWADFISFMLGAEPFSSNSLANRTLLFDLDENNWSNKLFDLTGIDKTKFGRVVKGGAFVGRVAGPIASELGIPAGAGIVAGGHDQCCNALGAGALSPGDMICGVGTYQCFTPVFHNPDEKQAFLDCGLNIEHHALDDLYVAFIFNQAGMLIKWFRDVFASELKQNIRAYELLENEMPDAISSIFSFPYFEPAGGSNCIGSASGGFLGLRTTSTRGEIYKAVMEAIEFHFITPLEGLRAVGISMDELVITGGGARSDKWAQIKADIYGVPVLRPEFAECGLTGCGILSGTGCGVFDSAQSAVNLFFRKGAEFIPDPGNNRRYREKYDNYKRLFSGFHKN